MNKKRLQGILSIALAILMIAFSLTSCSEGDGEDFAGGEIDYMTLDLSKYVTLGQYKGLNISIDPKPVITENDVTNKINADLISSGYTVQITDRAVKREDTVRISYVGLLDGVAFAGGTGTKDNFTVYDGGGFIDGFAEGIIGAMPGVETDVNVTFPEKYHSADLAGKPAVFKVTVHHIYEAKTLTDELASKLTGGDHTTIEAIRKYYSDRLNAENDAAYEETKSALTWNKIFSGVTNINIPDKMVDAKLGAELDRIKPYADSYGMDLDTYLSMGGYTRESLKAEIKNNILTDMVIYSIMKSEGITLTDEDYAGFIASSGYTEEQWLKNYSRQELTDMFTYTKTYNEAVKWQSFTEIQTDTQ